MVGALVTIRSMYDSFSAAHKKLARYILDNSELIPFQSVEDLAKAANVSVASVSRFAREAGYRSLKDFRKHLGKDALPFFAGIYQEILAEDNDETIIRKAFTGNIRSLEETLKIVDVRDMTKAARAIAQCRRLLFFGIGSSANIAADAAMRFNMLGIGSEAFCDSHRILSQAARMKKGDIAFGISHSGRSAITVRALAIAAKNGAMTIGMSNYLKSPLHQNCELFLCTSFPETRVKVMALSSRIAQMCLIDALYLLTARQESVSLAKAEQLNDYVEDILRIPLK